MTEISIADLRKQIAEIVNRASYQGERIVLTRHHKPVGAIVPMEDFELLEALEDRLDLEEALAVLRDTDSEFVPWEQAKAEL